LLAIVQSAEPDVGNQVYVVGLFKRKVTSVLLNGLLLSLKKTGAVVIACVVVTVPVVFKAPNQAVEALL
jgi:6,7-dimethyl-8-ribityllumazine synthase